MNYNNLNENIFNTETKTHLNDSIRLIFKYWYIKCKVYHKCHREASLYYDKINKYLGIPTILVGLFNTTSILSNYNNQDPTLMIINGTAAFVATVLSTMQNYFDLGKMVNIHSKLANGYSKITSSIEKILMYEKLTNKTEIQSKMIESIINQMEYLSEDVPYVPTYIWNKYKLEIKNIISLIINKDTIKDDLVSATIKEHSDKIDTVIDMYGNTI